MNRQQLPLKKVATICAKSVSDEDAMSCDHAAHCDKTYILSSVYSIEILLGVCTNISEMTETVTCKSLKKQNDSLKSQLNLLRGEFKTFQKDTMVQLEKVPNADMRTSSPSPDAETAKSLDFLSNEYDDFSHFRSTAEKQFNHLNKCLEDLAAQQCKHTVTSTT